MDTISKHINDQAVQTEFGLISGNRYHGTEISTLSCPDLTSVRQSGNTTRQSNFAIQCLFLGYYVNVEDHGGKDSNNHLFEKIVTRIQREYPGIRFKTMSAGTTRTISFDSLKPSEF